MNYLFTSLCVHLLHLLFYLVESTTDLDHQVEDISPPLFVSASFAISSDVFFSELNEEEDLSSVICTGTETEQFQNCNRAESSNPGSSQKKAETPKKRSIRLLGLDNNLPYQTKKKTVCSSLPGRKKKTPLRFRENGYTITSLRDKQNSSLFHQEKLTSLKSVNNNGSFKQSMKALQKKNEKDSSNSSCNERLLKTNSSEKGRKKRNTKAIINNSLNKKIVTKKVVKNEKEEKSSNVDITIKTEKQISVNNKTPGQYQCNHCEKVYQYVRGLRLHQKYTCSNSKFKHKFVCPYCPKKLNLKPSLRSHVQCRHKEKFVEWYEKNYSNLKYLQRYLSS